MGLCFAARVWIGAALCLLFLTALPTFAFDEDHHEIINGAMLHFRVRGTDRAHPYLVILHGGPGFSAHMFYAWGPSLEKTLNVVYLDQRGSGESARLTVANVMAPAPAEIKGYTVAALVEDIEGARRSLKIDKWYVLGHSWGGMLGLEYVTAHPDHVLGYIHMDGLVSVPQMQNAILDSAEKKFTAATPKNTTDLAQVAQIRALPPDSPARLFGALGLAMGPADLYFEGDQTAGFAAAYQQIGAALKPYHLAPAVLAPASEPTAALIVSDHFLTRDDTPLLAKVTVPTLILNGKQDGVIPPSVAEAAHAAIIGSVLVELDHCGHFPFFGQPEKTTAAVLAFTAPKKVGTPGPPVEGVDRFVKVGFTIDETGHATELHLLHSSGDPDLDQVCIEAVQKTRFRPEIKDGKPISVKGEHTFTIAQ